MADFCHSFLGILEEQPSGSTEPERSIPSRKEMPHLSVSEHDQDRVRTALKQMARDWSDAGAQERLLAYQPILDAVVARIPKDRTGKHILVPGSGLGRLAFEFARLGYATQGNEFSYFMLIPAHFVLNCTHRVHQHTLFPYIHSSSNWRSASDMLHSVTIPDVLPASLDPHVDFSMAAGEFVEVYAKAEERGSWDVVATCYFIDTAKNVLRYLEVINHVLPVGGWWVNVGPLLWHFEQDRIPSVELTLDELLSLLAHCGFELEEQRTLSPQTYTGVPHSMLTHHYVPEFWVCRKVRHHSMAPSV